MSAQAAESDFVDGGRRYRAVVRVAREHVRFGRMERDDQLTPLEKMQITLDLFEASVAIQRQNLRRAHPRASEDEIERLLSEWLTHRPGAEHGDAEGRPASRFPQVP